MLTACGLACYGSVGPPSPGPLFAGPAHQTSMKSHPSRTVRMEITSRFEMLDLVQTVLAHLTALVGFDEDAAHYISVAVRESVVNAIKHGNRGDETKRVSL